MITCPSKIPDHLSFYKSINIESPITYSSWMVFAIPLSVICLVIAWVWLQILYLGLGLDYYQLHFSNLTQLYNIRFNRGRAKDIYDHVLTNIYINGI